MRLGIKNLFKGLCLFLCLAVCISATCVFADGETDEAVASESTDTGDNISSSEYTKVAENSNIVMYADMNNGYFKISNKISGDVWSCPAESLENDSITINKEKLTYQSQLVIDYIDENAFVGNGIFYTAKSQIACVKKGNIKVSAIDKGIRVDYNFADLGIEIPIEYTIEDNSLKASALTKEIKESGEFSLIRLNILPSFASGSSEDTGYLFIPDGCGALVEFNNQSLDNTYSADIYGADPSIVTRTEQNRTEQISLPVFGLSMNKKGIAAIITKGDSMAGISAVVGNESCGINLVYSYLNYRSTGSDAMISQSSAKNNIYKASEQKYSLDTYDVVYTLLSGDNVSYVDIARTYRDYLINEKGLTKKEGGSLINLDVYGALETQGNFLGFKYKKLHSLTSYAQTAEIVKELKETGISDLAVRYQGWQNDGIFNLKQLKKSKILKVLGGKDDFRDMQEYLSEEDIPAWFEADLMVSRRGSGSQIASTVYNKPAYQYQYLKSVYVSKLTVDAWLNLSLKAVNKNAKTYLKSLDKTINSLSLSTLTDLVYSDFKSKGGSTREDLVNSVVNILEDVQNSGYKIMGDEANAYALPYVDSINNSPTLTSGYNMFDKEVPFYQIVLHGYIPMAGKAEQTEITEDTEFLKAVESGMGVLFNCVYEGDTNFRGLREEDLFSSSYTLWKERALAQYSSYNALYQQIKKAVIIAHEELKTNVVKTSYDNGIQVIVNYSYEPVEIGGIKIEARSFAQIGGERG